jgi:hypothetical protein
MGYSVSWRPDRQRMPRLFKSLFHRQTGSREFSFDILLKCGLIKRRPLALIRQEEPDRT